MGLSRIFHFVLALTALCFPIANMCTYRYDDTRIAKEKKGGKKKTVDPFAKKDWWYDIKAPSLFSVRSVGKTQDQSYKNFRLGVEDVQGNNVLTNFWGMDFTRDKLRCLAGKCHTFIEALVDVKTTDNFTLRVFCMGFTMRREKQVLRTCYAQSSHIRQIRCKMVEIMVNQASSCILKS
ncbi:hypothetical protein C5167_014950 [Papaver somniferum]|uniref:Uncharacterized protein n=1 Tax=Papaver somniferum TaxID=3469 RepID=A0A4Y7J6L0_PAPSO|nr:hypothetical protein C5167_014950 [Papaver somniferum]